ncbi:HNH endonuclease signature motif containing protein [Corynebacterium lizhenjunii]|uniref:HNH endonuclease signature motif containing protein n=1 Tax=Corynebacterium lizhenjunii TaxID=2709394 RepID=UPI001F1AC23B|nr:HNH endonuclease signature motif containing protein [Corynebacterium lizhenjunii]
MNAGDFFTIQSRGIQLVAECAGMSAEDFLAMGADGTTAAEFAHLVQVYFEPADAPSSRNRSRTRNRSAQSEARDRAAAKAQARAEAQAKSLATAQAAARDFATKQGHSLRTLTRIEEHVSRVSKDRRWELRLLLCSLPWQEHDTAAADFRGPSKQSNPERGVRMTRRANGNHTMSITDTPQAVADMYGVLTAQATAEAQAAAEAQVAAAEESLPGLNGDISSERDGTTASPDQHGSNAAAAGPHGDTATDSDTTAGGQANADLNGSNTADHHDDGDGGDSDRGAGKPYRPSPVELVDAAHTIFFGTDDNDDSVPHATRPQVRTNVIIRLEDLDTIIHGHGEEITVELTNGARMTGAQLVARKLAEIGLITLVHPFTGPVNLYTARSASYKQRLMAWAEHPTCAWPGCNKPAEESQIHHIRRHKDNGQTEPSNLVPLCKYHNGTNDDDPTKPTGRGIIDRINGRIVWFPPWGGPPWYIPSPAHPDPPPHPPDPPEPPEPPEPPQRE